MTDAELHDNVDLVDADDLLPYGSNPKEHPPEQVDKIASSIKRFGWDQPIVIDEDGEILKGHGRHQAARKLGLDRVPVIRRVGLTDAEKRAARIADNRTAQSEWDDGLLEAELELLDESDMSMEATAMDDGEIEGLIGPPPDFGAVDGDDQPRLDETEPVECPECGHNFDP